MTLMNVVILRCMVVSPSNPAMHARLTTPSCNGWPFPKSETLCTTQDLAINNLIHELIE